MEKTMDTKRVPYTLLKNDKYLLEKYNKLNNYYAMKKRKIAIGALFFIGLIALAICVLILGFKPVLLIISAILFLFLIGFILFSAIFQRKSMLEISDMNQYFTDAWKKNEEKNEEEIKDALVESVPLVGDLLSYKNDYELHKKNKDILEAIINGINYELMQIGINRPYVKSKNILKYNQLFFIGSFSLYILFPVFALIVYLFPSIFLNQICLSCVAIAFILLFIGFTLPYDISMMKYLKFAINSYKNHLNNL